MGEDDDMAAGALPFGTYVAVEPLTIDGFTLAHAPGDPVPYDNIERNGWAAGVRRVDVDPDTEPDDGEAAAEMGEAPADVEPASEVDGG